ncbi:MAG: Ig-like domain-containing protein, partial [SAR324 cluster bacterium]|nr:Ig-like domain-containing protein [SAR324 cluster bacterium]
MKNYLRRNLFFVVLITLFLNGCGGGGGSTNDNSSTTLLACQFNGASIASGTSVTAYQSSSVPNGNSCVSGVRTCSNGSLSGSYTFSGCTVAAETTAPTVTILQPDDNQSIVGTAVYQISFSEAVSGLRGNNLAAACEGNVQLTAALGGNCYPIFISTNDNVAWTVDPDGELNTGDYRFSVLPTGIMDLASNNLAVGDSVEFQIEDAASTVANELSSDLQAVGFSEDLADSVKVVVRSETSSVTNDLLNVIPAAFDGAYSAIISGGLSETETITALDLVIESLLSNIAGQNSLTSSTTARVAALPANFSALLTNLTTKVATKSGENSTILQSLSGALVRNLVVAGASATEIEASYVNLITSTTTTVVMSNNTDKVARDSLLTGLGEGILAGAKQITSVVVSIEAILTVTTATISETVAKIDTSYDPGKITEAVSATVESGPTPTPTSCELNGQMISNGEQLTAYEAAVVSFGDSCVSEVRSCANGELSGSYNFESCTAAAAASCELNGQTIDHGDYVTVFSSATVPFGSSCVSEIRSCTNGDLSGSYSFESCTAAAGASCELNGQTILDGANVTVFSTATVTFGDSCLSEVRSCRDGTLSGSYTHLSCTEDEEPTLQETPTLTTLGTQTTVRTLSGLSS